MRTAARVCSIHQSLTPEAITIVKQAITLARRRGHAQVTPIHVATVMLSSPAGLLTSACLKSSVHSHPYQCKGLELCFNVALNRLPATTSTPFMPPTHHHHCYPSLANTLMAAFKRAQAHQRRGSIEAQQQPILALKIETEQLVVSILDDPSVSRVMREAGFSSPLLKSYIQHNNNISINQFELEEKSDDVLSVIDTWVRRPEKSSVVVVGECLSRCEGIVMEVKERLERGDISIPMELKYVKFLNYPLSSMKSLSKEEIDKKLGEIRCLLKGCVGRGVVLYLGDIKWVAEYWAYYKNGDNFCNYCPIEHLIMGLRRLVFGNVENNGVRVWLMCISNFNSLIKCKVGNPSLETLLDLHPLTVPSTSLDLSLNLESKKNNTTSTSPRLPSWIQKCKEESREVRPHYEKTINLTMSCSPTSSNSISSYEPNDNYCKPITTNWPPMSPSITQKPELFSNPNSIPNSASSSQATHTCENLEELCFELERNVPWEKDIIPKIASKIVLPPSLYDCPLYYFGMSQNIVQFDIINRKFRLLRHIYP